MRARRLDEGVEAKIRHSGANGNRKYERRKRERGGTREREEGPRRTKGVAGDSLRRSGRVGNDGVALNGALNGALSATLPTYARHI